MGEQPDDPTASGRGGRSVKAGTDAMGQNISFAWIYTTVQVAPADEV
jgi:hypothetical protein